MVQHLYFIYLVGGLFTDPASTGTVLVTGHTARETNRRVEKVTLTSGLEIKISGFPRDLIPPTNPTPEVRIPTCPKLSFVTWEGDDLQFPNDLLFKNISF